jgi:hypothetical protein
MEKINSQLNPLVTGPRRFFVKTGAIYGYLRLFGAISEWILQNGVVADRPNLNP